MAGSGRKCCVPKCEKTRADDIILHAFPDPTKEPERFCKWVNAVDSSMSKLDSQFILRNRMICHAHFEEKFLTWTRRLAFGAVPSLNLPAKSSEKNASDYRKHNDDGTVTETGEIVRPIPEISLAATPGAATCIKTIESEVYVHSSEQSSLSGRLQPLANVTNTEKFATSSTNDVGTSTSPVKIQEDSMVKLLNVDIVCRACLKTDCKLYKMVENDTLWTTFQDLTGLVLSEEEGLPRAVCPECSSWLLACANFKSSSLRSHSVLQRTLRRHGAITVESVRSTNKFHRPIKLKTDQSDLDGPTDEQAEMYSDVSDDVIVIKVGSDRNSQGIDDEHNSDDNKEVSNDNDEIDLEGDNTDVVDTRCEDLNDDGVEEDANDDDMSQGTAFTDEDYPSDDELESGELTVKGDPRGRQAVGNGSGSEKLSCELCPYQTRSALRFVAHLKAHASDVALFCDKCDYATISKNRFEHHMKGHSSAKVFSCDYCVETFTCISNLNQHLKRHLTLNPYTCDVCKEEFKDKSHLRDHVQIHGTGKLYCCDVCKAKFDTKSKLNRHLRTHNSRGKPHICSVCGKRFRLPSILQRHIKIHIGEKLYSCHVCNVKLGSKTALKGHLLLHSGEKPYVCSVCGRKFRHSGTLRLHERIHNREIVD